MYFGIGAVGEEGGEVGEEGALDDEEEGEGEVVELGGAEHMKPYGAAILHASGLCR